jgi:hydroxymethylglutaryl-CoA lyase
MTPDVVICECFARDGLQHEALFVETPAKIEIIDMIAACGFSRVEATSYAHPAQVPQFKDADAVLRGIRRRPGVAFKATCPNEKAVQRALAAQDAGEGPEEISFLTSMTEGHSQRNLRRSMDEQWRNVAAMARAANDRFSIVGSTSVAFDCPFDGKVPVAVVIDAAQRFAALGIRKMSIGDTIGTATPPRVRELFTALQRDVPDMICIAHFHDTNGTAIANCIAALEAGARYFDTGLGGTGGHPAKIQYGEGFTGNVCTEDFCTLLDVMGVDTSLDLDAVYRTARAGERLLGRELHGKTTRRGAAAVRL